MNEWILQLTQDKKTTYQQLVNTNYGQLIKTFSKLNIIVTNIEKYCYFIYKLYVTFSKIYRIYIRNINSL